MKHLTHTYDLCVIGGGMAGLCAAIAAARHGIKTALVQDRPVLGGNASSEIRMHLSGAADHGDYNRETGIVEELIRENYYRNTNQNHYIWDSILFEKAEFQENLDLYLNCTVNDAKMNGNKIESVVGWGLTNETFHAFYAKIFADCSGDAILAPLTGAHYMLGREAKSEYGETIPPDVADKKTMGMSCLFQIRETDRPQKFIPPSWAYKYDDDSPFAHKGHENFKKTNWWWIELGGDQDSIHDTEEIRTELLKIAFGVWDHIKNRGDHGADNWYMEWIGFLPGKRESRRYKGKYVVSEKDVDNAGKHFKDIIAYGGWTMDDHFPAGFYHVESHPTIYHPAPSPWGIPYRALVSENIENLCFAGRNISVTHAALSSSRVMLTCAILGQALGTAAAIAVNDGVSMENVDTDKLREQLMFDDCYLPFSKRTPSPLTMEAKTEHEVLRNGLDRPLNGEMNMLSVEKGTPITFKFDGYRDIKGIRFIFDSDINRRMKNLPSCYPLDLSGYDTPRTLIKSYDLVFHTESGDVTVSEDNNYQRFAIKTVDVKADCVTFIPKETHGAEMCNVVSIDIL